MPSSTPPVREGGRRWKGERERETRRPAEKHTGRHTRRERTEKKREIKKGGGLINSDKLTDRKREREMRRETVSSLGGSSDR